MLAGHASALKRRPMTPTFKAMFDLQKFVMSATLILLGCSTLVAQASSDSLDIERLNREIGQMLMVGMRGSDVDNEDMDQIMSQIQQGEIGGIILFKHNIRNRKQIKKLLDDLNQLSPRQPLFLAADEEGGLVRRLRKKQGFTEFPSAAYVGKNMQPAKAYDVYGKLARQMSSTGLNLNLGPVVDVNVNGNSPAIGKLKRSFSTDPQSVTAFSRSFIKAHRDAGVLTALKHYPGHGSSKEDTHNDLTDITETWDSSEAVPFKELIQSNHVDMIMAGHLFDRNLDPNYPASISRVHIQENLRDNLGFSGVVITDDLQMGAIIKRYSLEEIIIAAINSGSDILQFSDPQDLDENLPARMREVVIKAIRDGRIDVNRIHESYDRIISLKQRISG